MKVKNIEIDLTDFDKSRQLTHYYFDIEVLHEYMDEYHYEIIVRRLDNGGKEGWKHDLFVLVNYISLEKTEKINIGDCDKPEKRIIIESKYKIEDSGEENIYSENYTFPIIPDPIAISREEFNSVFKTDIVTLPGNLYAVGIFILREDNDTKSIKVYMYNESYGNYYEVIFTVNLLLKVIAMTMTLEETSYYFIICSDDGYPEYRYMNSIEKTPKWIEDLEYKNIHRIDITTVSETEYPVFHSKQTIMAHSTMKHIPHIVPIIDRHYLYCNLYNRYRSIHRGIPFSQKQNKMILGCRQDRGSKYNFVERRDIEINQRSYFYTDFCDKKNVHYKEDEWITDHEMIGYKYILDIDGNASTWDATAWKLNSGSVIFKVDGPWTQWFYSEYLPYTHYIPIKDDMSDLQEKYQWCEEHPEECEKIVVNSKQLFQKTFRMSNIIKYIQSIL
jgi:hypothetical protein